MFGLRIFSYFKIGLVMVILAGIGCSTPSKQVLPQVGSRAVPEIFLADRPVFTALTQEEFDKIPITAAGKVLKNQSDWQAYGDIADAAVQGYRGYIADLFDKDAKAAAPAEAPPAPPKTVWYQFWK